MTKQEAQQIAREVMGEIEEAMGSVSLLGMELPSTHLTNAEAFLGTARKAVENFISEQEREG